jgi:ABC-type glutathione transport system ATPase component
MSAQLPEDEELMPDQPSLPASDAGQVELDDAPPEFDDALAHTFTAAELDPQAEPILTVDGLRMYFPVRSPLLRRTIGQVQAVDGVSFVIPKGGSLGLVGE